MAHHTSHMSKSLQRCVDDLTPKDTEVKREPITADLLQEMETLRAQMKEIQAKQLKQAVEERMREAQQHALAYPEKESYAIYQIRFRVSSTAVQQFAIVCAESEEKAVEVLQESMGIDPWEWNHGFLIDDNRPATDFRNTVLSIQYTSKP